MMAFQQGYDMFDFVMCLSNTIDLADPILANHNKQVAYIALRIGEMMGLEADDRAKLVMAGMLHDVGLFSTSQKQEAVRFEARELHEHGESGYRLLRIFMPLAHIADFVRFHHVFWEGGRGNSFKGETVPLESHILHLSDRIAVLVDSQREILAQVEGIYKKVTEKSGIMFNPDLVEYFRKLCPEEAFWLDIVSPDLMEIIKRRVNTRTIELDANSLMDMGRMFSKIIDFRSAFTASHSSGVAVCAQTLAGMMGFSREECRMMRTAGYLHDIGKLAIPADILEKEGKLTWGEFNIIRSHTYYTYRTLQAIKGLETVNLWASLHHERLDGTGYPFRLNEDNIPLGSRIMAVSDVFTAITEDRPYRKGMTEKEVAEVLDKMVNDKALDPVVVKVLKENFNQINHARKEAQREAEKEYIKFSEID